ncbi:hypothetical protein NEOLEDRAFT_984475 [Neolentinus lepideus HHB14362 ss-1]|uniref:Uncharacterized protein n=1 Tax=Neolentinus lepideus HHB14362 ss-1 TaxID=1314782 RepID=A0A165N682_9AGAM|nr:hypothetical protein NEOLEDRAFT_984475 [Neolentinus lepideus HHB14362 ss-1]
MANNTPSAPVISERAEIHKGCKSLETLVNVLNDYCEAASAIVALQKKLAKALREVAGLKSITEVAANALSSSAAIFEALSDVDTKFAKVADKECDGLSNEVKKWFKKLAKEEKAHDERITGANARIKQASQSYEKKVKKNARDAAEEHARYINLISVLGPEISQEKHNHALFITQRYTSTTYSVAATLSRIADAEWLRSCEGVRRFAPTVGQLGEWRALCEGGWMGDVPRDLDDPDWMAPVSSEELSTRAYEARRELAPDDLVRGVGNLAEQGSRTPPGRYTPLEQPPPQYNPPSTPTRRQQPSHSSTDGSVSVAERNNKNVNATPDREEGRSSPQLASLESFPSPPKHFPLPPVGPASVAVSDAAQDNQQQQRVESQSQGSSSVSHAITTLPRLAESPLEETHLDMREAIEAERNSSTRPSDTPPTKDETSTRAVDTSSTAPVPDNINITSPKRRPLPNTSSYPQQQSRRVSERDGDSYPKGNVLDDRELGVQTTETGEGASASAKGRDLGRRDSVGSIVATMRSRYDRSTVPASPPPRDVPRLPLSVSDLASKYQSQGGEQTPTSPNLQQRPMSPPAERAMSYAGESGRYRMPDPGTRERTMTMIGEGRSPEVDEFARRRQRVEELELREKELVLRERERELDERALALALERDHARVLGSRGDYFEERSQYSVPRTTLPQRYSYSTTHLVAPGSPQHLQQQRSTSHSRPTTPTEHAPFCGCDRCSASKYRMSEVAPSPRDLRPPAQPITLRSEKPKGWIRRLSMPVVVGKGNGFSLDSKKNASNASLASRRSVGMPDESGRLDHTGGIGNRAVASSARR